MLDIHRCPPRMLNGRKREYGISAAPTTIGANVRTIGTNRARITVFTPYFSKKAWAFSTRLGLNITTNLRG